MLAASLGKLLQANGFSVAIQKLDPYININSECSTLMSMANVTSLTMAMRATSIWAYLNGSLNIKATRNSDVTAGRVYRDVIHKEREGAYLGHTVQVVPHITNEIKACIYRMSDDDKIDFVIVEIGGTVGDIESLPFLEAERQVRYEKWSGPLDVNPSHFVPFIAAAKELKTKPTQHSVKELLELGIQPDMLVLRTEHPLNERSRARWDSSAMCSHRPYLSLLTSLLHTMCH